MRFHIFSHHDKTQPQNQESEEGKAADASALLRAESWIDKKTSEHTELSAQGQADLKTLSHALLEGNLATIANYMKDNQDNLQVDRTKPASEAEKVVRALCDEAMQVDVIGRKAIIAHVESEVYPRRNEKYNFHLGKEDTDACAYLYVDYGKKQEMPNAFFIFNNGVTAAGHNEHHMFTDQTAFSEKEKPTNLFKESSQSIVEKINHNLDRLEKKTAQRS
jgi:hypothetical protein